MGLGFFECVLLSDLKRFFSVPDLMQSRERLDVCTRAKDYADGMSERQRERKREKEERGGGRQKKIGKK